MAQGEGGMMNKVLGIGRDAESSKAVVVYLAAAPSDSDLREIHDLLRPWQGDAFAAATTLPPLPETASPSITFRRHQPISTQENQP